MVLQVEFFRLQLVLLYTVHITVSIIASALLLVILLMFRRFELFHSNLRTLLWHFLLCLLVNLYMQMIRILVPIFQQFFATPPENDNYDGIGQTCFQFNEFPASFCAFICVFGFLICVERLYATLRYVKYENESFEPYLTRFCIGMWILLAFCSTWQYLTGNSYGSGIVFGALPNNDSYFRCQIHFVHVNPLKTHWHILFAFLFYIVFCVVLHVILTLNRKKKEEYIEFYYSSLSHRFQIGENLKTVLLLTKIFPLTCLMFITSLVYKSLLWFYLDEADENAHQQHILLAEFSLLIIPMFSLIIALLIVRSSTLYRSKCKLIAKEFMNLLWPSSIIFWRNKTANGDTVTTSSLAAQRYCICCGKLHNKDDTFACEGDLLREYWDDYLHIE